MSPSLMFLSLPLSNGFGTGLLSSAFSPKDKGKCKVGRRGSAVGFGKGWGVEGEGREKRSKWPVHENESKFQSQTSQGRRKRKERAKTTGAQLFSFSFSSFFFFSGFGESSKARFLRDCATIRVSQVKSGQLDKMKSKESRAEREEGEGEGGRGCLYVCACFCARVSVCLCERVYVCVHKARFGKGGRYAVCVWVCVYVQRGPSPHSPSKRRLLRTKLLSTRFFKIVNVYSYFLVFCGLPFPFFYFTFQL